MHIHYTDFAGNTAQLTLTLAPNPSPDSGRAVQKITGTFNGFPVSYPTQDPRVPPGLTNEFYADPSKMPLGLRSGFAFSYDSGAGAAVLLGYHLQGFSPGYASDVYYPASTSGAATVSIASEVGV